MWRVLHGVHLMSAQQKRCRCLPCCGAASIWIEAGAQHGCTRPGGPPTWDNLMNGHTRVQRPAPKGPKQPEMFT